MYFSTCGYPVFSAPLIKNSVYKLYFWKLYQKISYYKYIDIFSNLVFNFIGLWVCFNTSRICLATMFLLHNLNPGMVIFAWFSFKSGLFWLSLVSLCFQTHFWIPSLDLWKYVTGILNRNSTESTDYAVYLGIA